MDGGIKLCNFQNYKKRRKIMLFCEISAIINYRIIAFVENYEAER
jgi:hypothetical protein